MSSTEKSSTCAQNGQDLGVRLTLVELLKRLDIDMLNNLDATAVRAALNVPEPPVTYEALTDLLCLGDSASEHPVADVLDVWFNFHRDVAFVLGAQLGAAVTTDGRTLQSSEYMWAWSDAVELHRGTLEQRRRVQHPSQPRSAQDCDGWCTEPHHQHRLDDGFHHRGASTMIVTSEGPGRDAAEVKVHLSRYAPSKDSTQAYEMTVDVDWPQNAGMATMTELTLDEADRLGRALLLKVHDARVSSSYTAPTAGEHSCSLADAEDRFVMPRKVERGVEHPQWCEVRLHCTVNPPDGSALACGWHRDIPKRLRGQDDDRLEFELSAGAFHDTDGAIDPPVVAVRVVEADMVDSFIEGTLLPDEARALAALLLEAADHAASLGQSYGYA